MKKKIFFLFSGMFVCVCVCVCVCVLNLLRKDVKRNWHWPVSKSPLKWEKNKTHEIQQKNFLYFYCCCTTTTIEIKKIFLLYFMSFILFSSLSCWVFLLSVLVNSFCLLILSLFWGLKPTLVTVYSLVLLASSL